MPKTIDPFDELAAMFLTGDSVPATESPAARDDQFHAEPRVVELLIVGNLPVRGNLWLMPYADAVAREKGSAALVRLDEREAAIQALGSEEELREARSARSMSETIETLGSSVQQWIVRVPMQCDWRALTHGGGRRRITILTSADETALVAAYQTIKEIVQPLAEKEETLLPEIGMAIVGTDEASARAAVERLNRAALSFLGVDLRLHMCLPRIDATAKATCHIGFRGQSSPSVSQTLAWIDAAIRTAPRQARVNPCASEAPVGAAPQVTALRPASGTPVPTPATAKLPPKPGIAVEAKSAEPLPASLEKPLATFIQGLTPLTIRPPQHDSVEMAVDGQGVLHLLCREPDLRVLRCAEAWARLHLPLLRMALPAQAIADAPACCHVFTDRPATLADLHGTGLHLHVLAPVTVNGQTGWYSAPLNVASPTQS